MNCRLIFSILFLMLLPACGKKTQTVEPVPETRTEKFKATELPVAPEIPSTEKTTQAAASARKDVVDAQRNVRTVLEAAQASDSAPAKAAVPALAAANGQLSSADSKLGSVPDYQAELNEKLRAMAAGYEAREKAKDADQARLQADCRHDLDDKSAQIQAVAAEKQKALDEIAKMKDEHIQRVQNIYMVIGIVLTLFGALGPIAWFVWRVPFGWEAGAILFPLGVVSLMLSRWISTIEWWTGWGMLGLVGAGVVAAVVYSYRLLHHPAPKPKPAAVKVKPKSKSAR